MVESSVINEYLSETIFKEAMPNDSLERASIRRWIVFAGENLGGSSMYMALSNLKQNKLEEANIVISNLQSKWCELVENSKLKEGKKFLFGDKLTLVDFSVFPFLQTQNISISHFSKKEFFEPIDKAKNNENLLLLSKYYQTIMNETSWKSLTYNIKSIPSLPILTELEMTTSDKYDYEKLLITVFLRR